NTCSSSTQGSPATARPCTRAGYPAHDGSSWSRRSRCATARSPCTTGGRAESKGLAPRLDRRLIIVFTSLDQAHAYEFSVRKPRHEIEFTAHRFNEPAQCADVEICLVLDLRDLRLRHAHCRRERH